MNARWQAGVSGPASTVNRCITRWSNKASSTWYKGLADEIRVKGPKLIAWMGLAMMVSTRLWVGGVVSLTRDRSLADRLLAQVRP